MTNKWAEAAMKRTPAEQELRVLTKSIARLERALTTPGIENRNDFDFLVDTVCRFMQRFHELAGYSWGEFKEVTS